MELIEKEKALDALLYEMCMTGYQSRAMDAIRFLPTIDATPVVRCGECHYYSYDVEYNKGWCNRWNPREVKGDGSGYCDMAARMDGGEKHG